MGHNDHGVLETDQELLKPVDGIHIQMVRRFIQQQDIRIAEESLRKKDLDLLRTVKSSHLSVMQLPVDAESVQQRLCVGLRLPAVHLGEFSLQLRRTDSVLIRKVLLRVDRVLLLHDLVEAAVSHNDSVKHIVVIVFEMVLLQKGDPVTGCHNDAAACRLESSRKNFQEGGLSRSVGSDQPVAVSLREFDVDVLE